MTNQSRASSDLADIQRGWLLSLIEVYEKEQQKHLQLRDLRAPNFVINPGLTETLGQWRRDDRQLVFSAQLLSHYNWADVVHVLRHEMAHQIADELFAAEDQTAHGPAFQRACDLLGISSAATYTLSPQACGGNPVHRRIQKLLAMGQSNNPHEAEAALAKAHELCLRYNVNARQASSTSNSYQFRKVGQLYRRVPAPVWAVVNLVSDFYFVRYICHVYWGQHAAFADGDLRQLEIYGTPENLDLAEHVFYFLRDEAERLWRRYRRDHGAAGRHRPSFLRGVFRGVRERLEKEREVLAQEQALVWLGDPALDSYFAARNPHIRRTHSQARVDAAAQAAGIAAGNKLRVRPPLTPAAESGRPRALLAHR